MSCKRNPSSLVLQPEINQYEVTNKIFLLYRLSHLRYVQAVVMATNVKNDRYFPYLVFVAQYCDFLVTMILANISEGKKGRVI